MTTSKLTKSQKKTFGPRTIEYYGNKRHMTVNVRYDDSCNNGHNSFAITADIVTARGRLEACGCLHHEIVKHFPELSHMIKWHLCSSDGPMYYVANTLYHVEQGKLDYARSCAIWPDATDEQLMSEDLEQVLLDRLPALMAEFQSAVESMGFVF